MKTLIIHNECHFIAWRKAQRAAYFINIRAEKKADFSIYRLPVTFKNLTNEVLFNNNQN